MGQFNQAGYNPSLMYDKPGSNTWAADGTTNTVTDANVTASSIILIMHTSAPNGLWYITPSAGSFLITSSDPETAGLTFKYLIL